MLPTANRLTLRSIRSTILLLVPFPFVSASLPAQAPDDGLMMPRRSISAGVVYAHDSWDQYWEATLKRSNGNIGTLTTQSVTFAAAYGATERLSVMASLPYVWTEASQGTLRGLSGIQDLTLATKFRLASRATRRGTLNAFIAGAVAVPMNDYTPDFYPLSIGTGGARASSRLTVGFRAPTWWFANASAAYTWCSNVTLDRGAYYTNGQLYMTNEVAMPNVLDYTLTAGIAQGRWSVPLSLVQQHTLGGGDIRRQDMPFVSNRMNFTRVDGAVTYALTMPKNVAIRVGAAHVVSGRNVGQSTTLTTGLFYALDF